MKRQIAQVEFFPLPVQGKTLVPRRTKTPYFTGAHDALEDALGNRSRLVPASSKTRKNAVFYSGSSGSRPGTVPSGGTLVPTPKGWSGNFDENPEPVSMAQAMGTSCDGCGRETWLVLVTDYGARYCRRCHRGD